MTANPPVCSLRRGPSQNAISRVAVLLAGVLATAAFAPTSAQAQTQPPSSPSEEQLRVRVRVRVLEWYLRDQLDTGFTALYLRDVDKGGNNVASADATFPSNAGPDEGLTAFFNRIRFGPGQVELSIQALEATNRLKVLSEPVLTVNAKSAKPAKFESGQDIPYETIRSAYGVLVGVTEFRQTGITLSIKQTQVYESKANPGQRFIQMDFKVNVSRSGQDIPVSVDQSKEVITAPQILSRQLDTTLFIPEHSPFIAGIIKSRAKAESKSGVPFLSEIPVIGALFRSTSKTDMDTELIFMVTAEVLWPESVPESALAQTTPMPTPPPPTKAKRPDPTATSPTPAATPEPPQPTPPPPAPTPPPPTPTPTASPSPTPPATPEPTKASNAPAAAPPVAPGPSASSLTSPTLTVATTTPAAAPASESKEEKK